VKSEQFSPRSKARYAIPVGGVA